MIGKKLETLYRRRRFGIRPGLDVEKALLAKLGNPERTFAAIHVAGTNGKGSVCRLVDSILAQAGLGVGLYTSPHLVAFNERMTCRGTAVSDEELEIVLDEVEAAAEAAGRECGRAPTFFEVATAAAMLFFRRSEIRVGILETGMGGRWDATNVVMPVVSGITRIAVEHTEYLGSDIETIAAEKCGIIKKGIPVVCGDNSEEAVGVVKRIAASLGSPCVNAASAVSVRVLSAGADGQKVAVESENASYGTLSLPLAGRHQLENLATALCCVEVFGQACGIVVPPETVKEGVASVRWPGRFQVISTDPVMIVDAAHNPNA
ncbi:MAG: bifunctional folylpolyglutamate synthase/dihydrofolate synthase, partial [Lentisphaerae bacterium]|nr:bifunctional folylpolyglutamate synthase/dihydrofolate synthase [Lentisphaerota bacterium]